MKAKKLEQSINAVVQIYVQGLDEGELLEILDPRRIRSGQWSGPGAFIQINTNEGYILTNAQVVKNGLKYKIRTMLTSEENFEVVLVGMIDCLVYTTDGIKTFYHMDIMEESHNQEKKNKMTEGQNPLALGFLGINQTLRRALTSSNLLFGNASDFANGAP